jgi:5-methylcytosine-specific restriction protein A
MTPRPCLGCGTIITLGSRCRNCQPRARQRNGWHWSNTKKRVLARDGYTCTQCGSVAPDLEVDHITPLSVGGTDDPTNLRTLCTTCHHQRHKPAAV